MTLRPRALATSVAVATLLASGALLTPSAAAEPAAGAAPVTASHAARGDGQGLHARRPHLGQLHLVGPQEGQGAVRQDRGAARLRQAQRHEDQDRASRGCSTPPRTTRASCSSTRAARAAPGSSCRCSGEYVPNGAGDGYDWIGFDPRGVGDVRPRGRCDPTFAGYDRPALRAGQPGARATPGSPSPTPTPTPARKNNGRDPRPPDHGRLGQRHGEHPQGARREADQLLRLLLRHLPRPGLRAPCTRRGCAGWCSTATSTRARSGTTRTSTRTWRSTRNIDIWFGWVAKYDSVYHLGTTAGGGALALLPPRRRSSTATRPGRAASSAAASGPTSSCTPATTSRPGPTWRRPSPA